MIGNVWVARTVSAIALLAATSCWALDVGGLFGTGGGGGEKVARMEFRLKDGSFIPTSLVWSPDGRHIATSGNHTRLIHIWDVEQRKLVKELELPNPPAAQFHNMAWSPDGKYLATCNSFNTQLVIYGTEDWRVAKAFGAGIAGACQKPLFSGDGQELTIWASDLITFSVGDWRITRRATPNLFYGEQLPKLRLDWTYLIRDVAYIPGTHDLVLAGGRNTPGEGCPNPPARLQPYSGRIWILKPNQTVLAPGMLVACQTDATHVAVDPSGQQISATTQAEDRGKDVVRVFDRTTGKPLAAPLDRLNEGFPLAVAYTPDGRYLIVGQNNGDSPGPVTLIDVATQSVAEVVHAAGNRVIDVAVHPRAAMFAAAAGSEITVWRIVKP